LLRKVKQLNALVVARKENSMDENAKGSLESIEDEQKDKFLTFKIGDEFYGLEIHYVIEIIGMQKITEIPEQPSQIKGVINLRGNIIPTMDIRARFNKEVREYDERTCTIVIKVGGNRIGLIVDRVSEVITIDGKNISNPPNLNMDEKNYYINGIARTNENIIILLDCMKLVKQKDVELNEMGEKEKGGMGGEA